MKAMCSISRIEAHLQLNRKPGWAIPLSSLLKYLPAGCMRIECTETDDQMMKARLITGHCPRRPLEAALYVAHDDVAKESHNCIECND